MDQMNTAKGLLKGSVASTASQIKSSEVGQMPTKADYQKISGSPLKDVVKLYASKNINNDIRNLNTSVNLKGVSKDGKQMIVEVLAPKIASKERNLLVAHAVQGSKKDSQHWQKKINGMNNEQARAFLKKNVGGSEFDRVNGGLSWGNVCNELKKLPLKAPDVAALQKNGYHLK